MKKSLRTILLILISSFAHGESLDFPLTGKPQIIQNADIVSYLLALSQSKEMQHKQELIDYIEYSDDGVSSNELLSLNDRIPALGFATKTMNELELPLVLFAGLRTSDPVLQRRFALLYYRLCDGKPRKYTEKVFGDEIGKRVANFLALSESTPDLEDSAYFPDLNSFPQLDRFLEEVKRDK